MGYIARDGAVRGAHECLWYGYIVVSVDARVDAGGVSCRMHGRMRVDDRGDSRPLSLVVLEARVAREVLDRDRALPHPAHDAAQAGARRRARVAARVARRVERRDDGGYVAVALGLLHLERHELPEVEEREADADLREPVEEAVGVGGVVQTEHEPEARGGAREQPCARVGVWASVGVRVCVWVRGVLRACVWVRRTLTLPELGEVIGRQLAGAAELADGHEAEDEHHQQRVEGSPIAVLCGAEGARERVGIEAGGTALERSSGTAGSGRGRGGRAGARTLICATQQRLKAAYRSTMSTVGLALAWRWMRSRRTYVVVRMLLRPCHCSSFRKAVVLRALHQLYKKAVASCEVPIKSSKCRLHRHMIRSGGMNARSVSTSKQKVSVMSNPDMAASGRGRWADG